MERVAGHHISLPPLLGISRPENFGIEELKLKLRMLNKSPIYSESPCKSSKINTSWIPIKLGQQLQMARY